MMLAISRCSFSRQMSICYRNNNTINKYPLMRRKSIDLFSEAKKRFQFKPASSRKLHVQEILSKKTVQCSNVKQKQKQSNSNDVSWLDKLIAACDIRASQHQQTLFEAEEREIERAPEPKKSISRNKNIIKILKQKQLNDKSLSMRRLPKDKPSKLPTEQRKARYIKQNQNDHYAYQNMTKNSSRDAIALSLSGQSSIRNDQKSSITSKSQPKSSAEGGSSEEVVQTSILELDSKGLEEQINRSQPKLTASDSLQITVLKVSDTCEKEAEKSGLNEPSIQVRQVKQPNSRSIGRIKKNNLRFHTIEVEICDSPFKQYYVPSGSLKRPQAEKGVTKYLKQQQSAIMQQDQSYCLSTSRAIQTKLSQILNQLDARQKGQRDRGNCSKDNLTEDIKILVESIMNKTNREDRSFTKKQFFAQVCKITTNFSQNQLCRLFVLSELNFSSRRESLSSRADTQATIKAVQDRNSSMNSNKTVIANDYEDSYPRRYSKAFRQGPATYRVKTESHDLESVSIWQQLHKQYQVHKALEKKRPQQLKMDIPKKGQKQDTPATHSFQSSKVPSWNSTMTREDLQPRIWRQPRELPTLSQEASSSELNRTQCEQQQSIRIEKLNEKLSRYIRQYIPDGASSFANLNFRQLEKNLPC